MLKVPSVEMLRASGVIPAEAIAVLLYGSVARGTSTRSSDIDLLALVAARPGRASVDAVSLVRYTPAQLNAMVRARSLFAWHLRTEGVTLEDPTGQLNAILAAHEGPDPGATLKRVCELASVLDLGEEQLSSAPGLARVASYLLRTAVYARSIQTGVRSFDLATACRAVDPGGKLQRDVERLRASRRLDAADLEVAVQRLESLAGPLAKNLYASLEGLFINEEESAPMVASLALAAMSSTTKELDYAQWQMPVL